MPCGVSEKNAPFFSRLRLATFSVLDDFVSSRLGSFGGGGPRCIVNPARGGRDGDRDRGTRGGGSVGA